MQLAFFSSTPWGISNNDQIYTVTTTNGRSTAVATLHDSSLTIIDAAVPAPSALVTLGLVPLLRRRRRWTRLCPIADSNQQPRSAASFLSIAPDDSAAASASHDAYRHTGASIPLNRET